MGRKTKPIFYTRYVDDIFVLMENNQKEGKKRVILPNLLRLIEFNAAEQVLNLEIDNYTSCCKRLLVTDSKKGCTAMGKIVYKM